MIDPMLALPFLQSLHAIETRVEKGELTRDQIDGLGGMIDGLVGGWHFQYAFKSWLDELFERIKTPEQKVAEELKRQEEKEAKAEAARLAALENAKPRMIEDMRRGDA